MTADAARRLAEDIVANDVAGVAGLDASMIRLARALLAALDREARAVALLERLTEMDVGFNDALDEARAFLAALLAEEGDRG